VAVVEVEMPTDRHVHLDTLTWSCIPGWWSWLLGVQVVPVKYFRNRTTINLKIKQGFWKWGTEVPVSKSSDPKARA